MTLTEYVSGKGEKRLGNIEDSVEASIQRLEDYTEKYAGNLSAATRNNTDNMKTNGTEIIRKKMVRKTILSEF